MSAIPITEPSFSDGSSSVSAQRGSKRNERPEEVVGDETSKRVRRLEESITHRDRHISVLVEEFKRLKARIIALESDSSRLKKIATQQLRSRASSSSSSSHVTYGDVTLSNGNLYRGQLHEGTPHGTGKIYLPNGKILYDGHLHNGQVQGKGKIYYDDGTLKHEGEFYNGTYHGSGKSYYLDGRIRFEGVIASGQYHSGVHYRRDGSFISNDEFKAGMYSVDDFTCSVDDLIKVIKWEDTL